VQINRLITPRRANKKLRFYPSAGRAPLVSEAGRGGPSAARGASPRWAAAERSLEVGAEGGEDAGAPAAAAASRGRPSRSWGAEELDRRPQTRSFAFRSRMR